MKSINEKVMKIVFLVAACTSVLAVALICIFLFANGIPAMKKIGFAEFLTGTKWKPGNNKFGIFPMILGSIYVTGGALIIGVPVGVLTSIFMAKSTTSAKEKGKEKAKTILVTEELLEKHPEWAEQGIEVGDEIEASEAEETEE